MAKAALLPTLEMIQRWAVMVPYPFSEHPVTASGSQAAMHHTAWVSNLSHCSTCPCTASAANRSTHWAAAVAFLSESVSTKRDALCLLIFAQSVKEKVNALYWALPVLYRFYEWITENKDPEVTKCISVKAERFFFFFTDVCLLGKSFLLSLSLSKAIYSMGSIILVVRCLSLKHNWTFLTANLKPLFLLYPQLHYKYWRILLAALLG